MARMLFFATARHAAGVSSQEVDVATLEEALNLVRTRFGTEFARVLAGCRVWVNGDDPTGPSHPIGARDEIAVIPPVAGG
ncbi:MoaD/ThiS family protein [Nocardioides bruguierae]|uniref:Molybdopterin synthase sulfur carrier subunit n=1 Tax=Nocardioides bruguierae TaxID=2945102 RepID=A0A9X2DB96_9ACTN|nr:MoaD/ThiS family protein [Nocardioides bruguierae]MCM0622752.1 MoaD/ThiS family protein [Nocardioides bruguierae]